ncbi:MAG: hypothetical protein AAB393_09845 [Bacteroidota bacterium]
MKDGDGSSEEKHGEVASWLSLALGMMLFLNETRSTGEALERFRLIVHLNALSVIGGATALAGVAVLLVLFLASWKGNRTE